MDPQDRRKILQVEKSVETTRNVHRLLILVLEHGVRELCSARLVQD